jgi:microcystin-dependent protein
MDGQFLGQIQQVAFNFAPKSWATCAAQLLAIAQNQALFSILGTTYGGNGIQTFALPDLRGRVALHWGTGPGLSPYQLGQQVGTQSVTMLSANMPSHTHLLTASNTAPAVPSPNGGALAQGGPFGAGTSIQYGAAAGTTMSTGAIAPAGNSVPISIMQPYNTLQYCIALQGIFPTRN